MTAAKESTFPQRDASNRIRFIGEFAVFVLASLLLGVAMLTAVDGVMALLGFSTFGDISGWICGLLAAFVFIEDFRSWKSDENHPLVRWMLAAAAAILGLVFGLGVLSVMPISWPPLFNGSLAVSGACLLYALLWFLGIRLATGERPEYGEEN